MTRLEWIAAYAARYARLTGLSLDLASKMAAVALDGSGSFGESQNLHRDPCEMADEQDEEDGQP